MKAGDIPLRVLLHEARRKRAIAIEFSEPDVPRGKRTEANQVATLDVIVDWLTYVPVTEWAQKYIAERPER